ncbi:UL36 very large tegument protein [Streptomyces sp. NPDC048659]|uniref:UL36 very large tegument protein n=1 Tax=Streptomyces sp. NPDC048659 TaxID=3155489 RepID=UPI0034164B6F
MTVHQLPVEFVAFAGWLSELAGRLRPGGGWYGVFAARDPEGLRACFEGTELPPWDVVESLLQDLGEPPGAPRAVRGRALHRAAAVAHDRAPGAAAALTARRELMEHEAHRAGTRVRELAASPGPELAWARDDLARARARVAELTARLARVAPRATHPGAPPGPGPAPAPAPAPSSGKGRPRGARYAWLDGEGAGGEGGGAPVVVPGEPALPVGGALPRGARFGGALLAPEPTPAPAPAADPGQAARAAANAVYALRRLRAQGRGGDAHGLLCEALAGPPGWLPALADELHRAGLAADWATLLWEAASLPPARLAAVAGALADAGRPHDCEQLLRQGVARPVEELAGACAALFAEGHEPEARALLAAFLRVRAPEDAARLAALDPSALTPHLLAAARTVSPSRARDLLHALRVAGLA